MKPVIVTYHSDVETTSFFMTQIEEALRADGYRVCPLFFDALPAGLVSNAVVAEKKESAGSGIKGTETFEDLRNLFHGAVFLTFNFAGIYSKDGCFVSGRSAAKQSGEKPEEGCESAEGNAEKNADKTADKTADKNSSPIAESAPRDRLLVDECVMRCVNIIVDHPYHYHDFLYEQERFRSSRYLQFCIDRQHIAYMQTYFPNIALGELLPSGGTEVAKETGSFRTDVALDGVSDSAAVKWKDRHIDLLFAATCVEPSFFDVFIDRNGPEYSAFYHSILDEALADPEKKLEDIIKRRMEEEIEEGFSFEELRLTLGHIQFLDYYVRYRRRIEVVRALADGDSGDEGLHLTIVGNGWENVVKTFRHPERVTLLPYADSAEVLRLMENSKLVLNVLPSFHEGAHDRIFNAMLCGAVCVTDGNAWLDKILQDGENALVYDTLSVREKPVGEKPIAMTENAGDLFSRLSDALSPERAEEMERIAAAGKAMAAEHTWQKRAAILERGIQSFYD